MATKRIKDLTNTATEAALVSGNYLPIDGTNGTKKLPAEMIFSSFSQITGTSTYASLDDLPLNSSVVINAALANRPISSYGVCVTSGSSNVTECSQIYITRYNRFFARFKYAGNWTDWKEFEKPEKLNIIEEREVSLSSTATGFEMNVVAGHAYMIKAIPSTWSVSTITPATANVFYIQAVSPQRTLAKIAKQEFAYLYDFAFVPDTSEQVRFRFRGDSGSIQVLIYDVTYVLDIADKISKSVVEEYNKSTVMNQANGKVVLNGNTPVHFPLSNLIPNHTYSVILNPYSWPTTEVTSDNAFYIQKDYSKTYFKIPVSQLGSILNATFTYTEGTYRLSFRGDTGTEVSFAIVDITFISEQIKSIGKESISSMELRPSISFFESVGIIGASFESGVVYKNSSTSMGANYPKSWPQILARESGVEFTNYSFGGADSKTWLTNSSYGLQAMNADTAKELYILNLGSNDSYHYGNGYIGTVADIGTETDSFFGNMSKIIDAIQTKAPNARIIVCEIRTNTSGSTANYNVAIKELAEYYGIPYVTPYDDPFYATPAYNTFVGGHPQYMGYAGMAKAWRRMVEECMANNLSYFNHIPE